MKYSVRSRVIAATLLVALTITPCISAQSIPSSPDDSAVAKDADTQPVQPEVASAKPLQPVFQGGFAQRLLDDQKSIWLSPFRLRKEDAKWLVPIAGATTFAFTTDNRSSHYFDNLKGVQTASHGVSQLGSDYAIFGASGAMLGLGKLTHNERLATTGALAVEAGIAATGALQGLKMLTQRTRPYLGGNGDFWNGGNSFPSGHTIMTWSFAKVVADQYPDKPWLKFGMYGLATAVSISRVSGQRHYVSDVIVGSAIGYLIGKYITHRHNSER
jgi:PAP2 superfamily